MKRNAFTMIELVFVIVILGILAAVAIPRFAATRDDAQITKGRSDVAAIRSAIVSERQTRLLKGDIAYVSALDGVSTNLFDGPDANHTLLQYGIAPGVGNGKWAKTAANTFTYTVLGDPVAFTYTQATGAFDCTHTNLNCKRLTE
ncbi:MAG: prepilin-type N-terminal cleavage/methylation domain-containing protein [Sulfuricurvum sp.]|nr:prepilin-type N-terminal cleavage/methylation domain-containing protein [Sulfuricurvum sp.]